jgi:hypothetical protein
MPLDVASICRSFGFVEPVIERTIKPRHGGLRRIDRTWQPIVYRMGDGGPRNLTPRERFTAMHEVAHALIEREFELRPQRNSEYWSLESVCDRYAASMLVPDSLVRKYRESCVTSDGLLTTAMALSSRCIVTIPCAAKRLVGANAGSSAWGLVLTPCASPAVGGRWTVEWDSENPSRFKLRRPAKLGPDHPLMAAIARAGELVGEQGSAEIGNATSVSARRVSPTRVLVCARWYAEEQRVSA